MSMSIRNVPCPKCGVHMRRLYIQQGATEPTGKRRNTYIAIARGCINCGYVEWDKAKGGSA